MISGEPEPGPGREVAQHLRVLDGAHRVHGVHADGVHGGDGHNPEGVHDGVAEPLAHGAEHLLAVLGVRA